MLENNNLKIEIQSLKNTIKNLENQNKTLLLNIGAIQTLLESHEEQLNLEQQKGDALQVSIMF